MKTGISKSVVVVLLVAVVAIVVFGIWRFFGSTEKRAPRDGAAQAALAPAPAAADRRASVSNSAAPAGAPKGGGSGYATAIAKGLATTNQVPKSPEQVTAAKMSDLLEGGDEKGALVIARQLMNSKDAEIRREVVDTLGWLGVRALPELSALLADESEEVAAEAFRRWEQAVDEVSDEALKAQLLAAGMQALKGEDDLEACAMEFNSLPDDIAVRGLLTVIQSSNPVASEVARGHYAFVTGNAYTTPADAEKWIAENVEPPEAAQPAKK